MTAEPKSWYMYLHAYMCIGFHVCWYTSALINDNSIHEVFPIERDDFEAGVASRPMRHVMPLVTG